MPNKIYEDGSFEYEEIQEQGFIRTEKREKPGRPLSQEERIASLEADVVQLKAQVQRLLKPPAK